MGRTDRLGPCLGQSDEFMGGRDALRRHKRIVKGLPTLQQAVFIEQQLEVFLEIVDRPVRGEA